MKPISTGLLLGLLPFICLAQTIERKIIVENNSFFYTTIHEEFQVGTLCTGSISESLNKAKKLALPAGRNYNEPLNPFSWDLKDSEMVAVNFLNHPLNNKNEALKRFKLSSLKEWGKEVTTMDMVMQGVEENRFAYNDPYKFIKRQSSYLNGFYFDGIMLNDSTYVMAIANNNQLSIWRFISDKWIHSEPQLFNINGFFSLIEKNGQLYLIFNNGTIHNVSLKEVAPVPLVITTKNLNDYTVIINRDRHVVQFIRNEELNKSIPFNELIEKKGIYIF